MVKITLLQYFPSKDNIFISRRVELVKRERNVADVYKLNELTESSNPEGCVPLLMK